MTLGPWCVTTQRSLINELNQRDNIRPTSSVSLLSFSSVVIQLSKYSSKSLGMLASDFSFGFSPRPLESSRKFSFSSALSS